MQRMIVLCDMTELEACTQIQLPRAEEEKYRLLSYEGSTRMRLAASSEITFAVYTEKAISDPLRASRERVRGP